MQKLKQKIALLVLIMQLLAPALVQAASAPASLYIPGTTLTISGTASPKGLVQVFDANALIGSVVANSSGTFTTNFPSMSAGLHPIRLVYTDQDGLISNEVKDTIHIKPQQSTSLEYFLPPTINIIPRSVSEGDFISIKGSSAPKATVEILIDGGGLVLRPQTDSSGRYTIAFSTTSYYSGDHVALATSKKRNKTSYATAVEKFNVRAIGSSETNQEGRIPPPTIANTSPLYTSKVPIEVRGLALPNSQIVIYVDGVIIGSTFATDEGSWFISLIPHANYHQLRAIACVDDECSDFSNLLEIIFEGDLLLGSQPLICPANFRLENYRYWNIAKDDGINIDILDIRGELPVEWVIDWGDGTIERFNEHDGTPLNLHHVFRENGQFNASVTIADSSDCIYQQYFSIDVVETEANWQWLMFGLPLTVGLLGAMIIRQKRSLDIKAAATARLG